MKMNKILLAAGIFFPALALGGCGTLKIQSPDTGAPVTTAANPTSVKILPDAERALACIRESGAVRNVKFKVGATVDSTGRINAVAPGSIGALLPNGGSSVYVVDAIRNAGGQAFVGYLGPAPVNVATDFTIHAIFNALDFSKPVTADVRVAGIGPIADHGVAMLSQSIQMDHSATLQNAQVSLLERNVRYTRLGVGVGSTFNGTTLVTGEATIGNQERLQFEALNGPIALGVADAIVKQFPAARARCGAMIATILKQDGGGV